MNLTTAHRIAAIENDRMRKAAEILLQARRDGQPIDSLPEQLRPHSLDEAYALQDIVAFAQGAVGGWKIGAPAPDAVPLFSPMPLWGGFAASGGRIGGANRRYRGVEGEIAFQLGRDLPVREQTYSREEVTAAIGSAHPVIELLEPAFLDPDSVDRLSMIGDLQMHGGFVYGAALPDWQSVDLAQETVCVTVNGVVRFTGTASISAGTDLLRLVIWLANEGSARTGGLRAGDWVTTGSWSGKTLAESGSQVEVRFSNFGSVTARFE